MAIYDRGSESAPGGRHVGESLPAVVSGVVALERRRVLVGRQRTSANCVDEVPVRGRRQVFTRGWDALPAAPSLAVEHLGGIDQAIVGLAAHDHDLIANHGGRGRPQRRRGRQGGALSLWLL